MAEDPLLTPRPQPGQEVSVSWTHVEGFVAQLAHDVRNGLNACELQLTFLGEICTDPEAVDEVKRLRGSLQAVTKQLQALRTATGPVTVYPLDYPAGEFFEDLRERLQRQRPAEAGRADWQLALDAACQLKADPSLSLEACLELLDNAFHFPRAPDARVQCTATTAGDKLTFTVASDAATAPAIPPEDWGRQPLRSTKRGGYGLGLFRVRRIAEAQGGTLAARYDGAARRVSVVLTLPCTLSAVP